MPRIGILAFLATCLIAPFVLYGCSPKDSSTQPTSKKIPQPSPQITFLENTHPTMTPTFDSEGIDSTTFAPFVLHDCRDTESKDTRLEFSDWEWLHEFCEGDYIGDYYLNGPGVEGLVMATRHLNGLESDPDSMDPNSEGDTCYIHFINFEEAAQTAQLCATMIKDKNMLHQTASVAVENGFGD